FRTDDCAAVRRHDEVRGVALSERQRLQFLSRGDVSNFDLVAGQRQGFAVGRKSEAMTIVFVAVEVESRRFLEGSNVPNANGLRVVVVERHKSAVERAADVPLGRVI